MPTSIDSLQIDIIAQSNKADIAIDRLVSKLDKLSNSLGKIPVGSISSLASGVDKLGRAMQVMGSVDSRTFTRLANNINKLSQVNVASINTASSSIQRLSKSLNILGNTSSNTQGVVQLSSALGKLGGKSVSNAIVNIPLLATAMNELMVTLSKSPTVSRNVIDLANALANLAHNGKRIGTASRSVASGLHNTRKSMEITSRSATSLAATFGKLYANYFLIIRGAKAFVNAIKGTSDYIEAFNYYNVAFGKIASEWDEDWKKYGYENAEAYADSFTERMQESLSKMSGLEVVIDADGKGLLTSTNLQNLGLNIREITQYASQLASVTNSVGQTGEVSLAAARSFTKLGADISSLFNIDYSDAMKNLQSGLIGQSRALYKYGIDITNATLSTYAFELGLKKSVSEMTQAEKMQLRMIAILDQSKVAWGDLANTINSPSNMLRQFKNNLSEVGMVLGQLFLPLMERVMPVVNGATIAIKNFLVSLANLLGVNINFDAFGQGFSDLADYSEDLSDGLDDLSDSAKKVTKSLGKFDELNNISLPGNNENGNGLSNSIDLTQEIIEATEEYEKVWNKAYENMEAKAQSFAKKLEKYMKPVKGLIANLFSGNYYAAGFGFGEITNKIYTEFTEAIENVNWEGVGKSIGKFLKGINWWEDVIKPSFKLKQTISDAIAKLWFGSLEKAPFETIITTFLAGLVVTGNIKIVLAPILAFQAGFSIGKEIGKLLFPEGKEFYETFTWFDDGGFFDTIVNTDIPTLLNALEELQTKIRDNDIFRLLTGTFILPKKTTFEELLEKIEGLKEKFKDFVYNSITYLSEFRYKSSIWFSRISDDFVKYLSDGIKNVKDLFEKFLINISEKFSGLTSGGFTSSLIGVPKYATGGFPEDGLFMANHNELVGGFGNGKTAVANNEQITEGIANAVYPAVYNAVVAAMSNGNNGSSPIKIEIGGREVFRAVQDEANDYSKRTGKPAFS